MSTLAAAAQVITVYFSLILPSKVQYPVGSIFLDVFISICILFFCSSCFNGGTCVDGINTFTCLCPPGFTGIYCQHDINECDSKPCLNGGTCQDSYGTYKCTCPHGYTGLNCQVRRWRGTLHWSELILTEDFVSLCDLPSIMFVVFALHI